MSDYNEEFGLTPEERLQARDFWDALMFAPTSFELDATRLKLMGVSASVQHAVMTSITQMWLKEYEPRRDENPFNEKTQMRSELGTVQEEMIQEHQEQSAYYECEPQRDTQPIRPISAHALPNQVWLCPPLKSRSKIGA